MPLRPAWGYLHRKALRLGIQPSKVIIDGCRKAVEYCQRRGIDIVKVAIQFACARPDIATTLVSTARPSNIRDNIAYVEEPADESLLAEVIDLLKPIRNFNFTRGRLEHRDLLVGPADESRGLAN